MSDLISRSALIESLIRCKGLGRKSCKLVADVIKNEPAAYDVGKVVEEIKNIGTRYCIAVHCNDECSNCDHGAIMRAIIKIVKQGLGK